MLFSSFCSSVGLFLQEEDLEQSALEFINNSAMPLELTPPSPALKLPYTSPSANGVSTFSKAASGISSMPSLDVLQEQEGLESNGIVWNGGCEITEGTSCLLSRSILGCFFRGMIIFR